MRAPLLAAALPICLSIVAAPSVLAQAINIDFGDPLSSFGVPASTFGAASGQSGEWNALDTASGGGLAYSSQPLRDTTGAVTAVTLAHMLTGGASIASFDFDDPQTSGDAQALMDDINWANGSSLIEVSGLAPGPYQVFTYCMAPDSSTARTTVDVVGSLDPLATVGGTFAGFVRDVTHAEHVVALAAGATLMIAVDFTTGFDSVNGLQIVPLGPGGPIGSIYCPGVTNSTSGSAEISATGSRFAADNDVTLTTTGLPVGVFAFYVTSRMQALTPNPGGSTGNLCLGGSIGRYDRAGEIQVANAAGEVSLVLDLTDTPQPTGAVPALAGETWNWQCWYRDQVLPGVAGSNLSSAISITLL